MENSSRVSEVMTRVSEEGCKLALAYIRWNDNELRTLYGLDEHVCVVKKSYNV